VGFVNYDNTTGVALDFALSVGSVRSIRGIVMLSMVVICGEHVRLMTMGRTWTSVRSQWSLSILVRGAFFVLLLDAIWEELEHVQYLHSPICMDEMEVKFRLPYGAVAYLSSMSRMTSGVCARGRTTGGRMRVVMMVGVLGKGEWGLRSCLPSVTHWDG
jgi:hypothetical protein